MKQAMMSVPPEIEAKRTSAFMSLGREFMATYLSMVSTVTMIMRDLIFQCLTTLSSSMESTLMNLQHQHQHVKTKIMMREDQIHL